MIATYRAQRDADPRAQVVSVDQAPITEAGGKVKVGAERLIKTDVNNLAAQVQGHTQHTLLSVLNNTRRRKLDMGSRLPNQGYFLALKPNFLRCTGRKNIVGC